MKMENQSVNIIQLTSDQWQIYQQLRLEALQNDPQAFGSSYQDALKKTETDWRSRLEDANQGRGSWLLFAGDKQSLLGMIAAVLDNEQENTAIILSVYVTPQARGKGISKKLMAAILDAIKADGVKKAWLEVNTEQLPALHLYQRFGFEIVKINHNLLGTGCYHDEFLMVKEL